MTSSHGRPAASVCCPWHPSSCWHASVHPFALHAVCCTRFSLPPCLHCVLHLPLLAWTVSYGQHACTCLCGNPTPQIILFVLIQLSLSHALAPILSCTCLALLFIPTYPASFSDPACLCMHSDSLRLSACKLDHVPAAVACCWLAAACHQWSGWSSLQADSSTGMQLCDLGGAIGSCSYSVSYLLAAGGSSAAGCKAPIACRCRASPAAAAAVHICTHIYTYANYKTYGPWPCSTHVAGATCGAPPRDLAPRQARPLRNPCSVS